MNNTATISAPAEAGRRLAERLGLKIVGTEGHDLKCSCISCDSSDAARVHQDSGAYFCYSCGKALSGWDLCKVVLKDHEAAKRIMHELGFFPELFGGRGNGNGHGTPAGDIIDLVARRKGTTREGFLAYGAVVSEGHYVAFPTFRLEGGKVEQCSYFCIDANNPGDKGLNAKGKPAGCFLPGGGGPKPDETWIITEGKANGPAYHAMGYKAVGLNGHHVKREFLPGFAAAFAGVDVILAPDGDHESIAAFRAIGEELLQAGAKSVKLASLPYSEIKPRGGDDVRDCLKKQDGQEAVLAALAAAAPITDDATPEQKIDYGLISGVELLRGDYTIEWLIPYVMARLQHMLWGGPLKACKSLTAIAAAVALALGDRFLGHFPVTRPTRVMYISGESGWPVFQENVRRISRAMGASDEQLDKMIVGVRLPKFASPEYMDSFLGEVKEHEPEAVFLDCVYRCIPGDNAMNALAMGELLDSAGRLFEDCKSTLVLLHHTPKHVPVGEPIQPDNLAFAGIAEFAAQWFLLNRQRTFVPGSGHHDLWLTIGGRAGHGGTYGLTIDEGEFRIGCDREWRVNVTKSEEVWKGKHDQAESDREAKRLEKLEGIKKRILRAAAKHPAGETATIIRDQAGLNDREFKPALAALLDDGDLIPTEITKSNRKAPYAAYMLATQE